MTTTVTGCENFLFHALLISSATLTWNCNMFSKHTLGLVYALNLILLDATLLQARLMPWFLCGMLTSWLAYVLSPGKQAHYTTSVILCILK
jgi:uncharacterized membrane protein YecN with MAPEG domain